LSITIAKILKEFWPYIAAGVVLVGLLAAIKWQDSRIESLKKDVKICRGELEKSEKAFDDEKEAFVDMKGEYTLCVEGSSKKEASYKDLYNDCMKHQKAFESIAAAIRADDKECVCEPNECAEHANLFKAYNEMWGGW
jgi:hypothetical protein